MEDPAQFGFDDFLNHSCEPNLRFSRGTLTLYALRRIVDLSEWALADSSAGAAA